MNINFYLFINENYDNININVQFKNVQDIINFINNKYNFSSKYIEIYDDNLKLNSNFKNWDINGNYIIIINNLEYFNITISYNNKNIILPQVNINTKVLDLKNILSTKDDIFYNNIKLKDCEFINKYFQNNFDIQLYTHCAATTFVSAV